MARGDVSAAELANGLKAIRKAQGLTQSQLAEDIAVSRKTINTIENGVFVPSTVLALKIAARLEVRVEEIFWLEAGPTARR